MDQIRMTESLGLDHGQVRLSNSHPRWPDAFEQFADELRTVLGEMVLAVEHIGSTSVPGLTAKPILDIAVALAPEATSEDVTTALEALGYLYRGDKGDHGGLLFVMEDRPAHRIAHVHVVEHFTSQWHRWLAFRDLLRADPDIRAEYDRLKRELADQYPNDRQAYTVAKTSFVTKWIHP